MTPYPPRRPGGRPDANPWARYAGLGIQFGLTLGAFGLIGWWLDAKFGTEPWLFLLTMLLAFVGATVSLVHKVPPSTHPPRSRTSGVDTPVDARRTDEREDG
jgi:hypothetical protein